MLLNFWKWLSISFRLIITRIYLKSIISITGFSDFFLVCEKWSLCLMEPLLKYYIISYSINANHAIYLLDPKTIIIISKYIHGGMLIILYLNEYLFFFLLYCWFISDSTASSIFYQSTIIFDSVFICEINHIIIILYHFIL